MSAHNIEKFNEITGQVLAYLYVSFPVPVDLSPASIGIDAAPDGEYAPTSGLVAGGKPKTEDELFFGHSVAWLIATGYLSADRLLSGVFFCQAVLTAKGLEVLKATPASLSSSSFGEQLQTAAKDGMLDTIKSLTNEALSRGVGLATSAAVAWANSQG